VAALPLWKQLAASVKQDAGHFSEEEYLLPLRRIEPRFLRYPARNLGAIPSTLSLLLYNQQLYKFVNVIKTKNILRNSKNGKACLF
jgi:hypothetical protein